MFMNNAAVVSGWLQILKLLLLQATTPSSTLEISSSRKHISRCKINGFNRFNYIFANEYQMKVLCYHSSLFYKRNEVTKVIWSKIQAFHNSLTFMRNNYAKLQWHWLGVTLFFDGRYLFHLSFVRKETPRKKDRFSQQTAQTATLL